MSDGKASPEKLEKEVRVLRRKLERSEWHRADLENQHDRDQHLYRRLHAELEAAHREAEIEASLERVRAHALAMRSSDELLEVVFTIHREYSGLGFPCGAFWQTRYTPDVYRKALTGIDGTKLAAIMELPRDFASNPTLAEWERGDEDVGVFKFDTDAACEYHHHMVTKGKFFEVDPEAITQEMIRENHGWTFVQARTSHGEIGYSLWGETDPTQEAKDVLVRFAKTFDLAYRRFLDLQKAEEQVREAEIELALERVRARTMAMQQSSDISEVAHVLYQQLESLGGQLWGTGFAFCTEDADADEFWFVNQGGILPTVSIPNTEDAVHKKMYEGWKKGVELFTEEKGGEELKAHYEYMLTVPDVKGFFEGMLDSGLSFPTWQRWHAAYFSHGYLLVIAVEPYEDERIFVRFAKVFEQAYIRFRDLQAAEAQAREAEVQLALERIRTQSMRMQHSSELVATSTVFHEQLLGLGVATEFSYVWLPDESAGKHQFWATWAEVGNDGPTVFRSKAVTYDLDKSEPYTAACFAAWESKDPICVAFIPPEDVVGFFSAWPELLSGAEHMTPDQFADGLYYAEAYMRYGCFGINIRHEPTKAERDIIRRFSNEFERAYTRFLDLQRAEQQARQAVREASLDRVRAEIASMRTADDLERITPIIWKELNTLDVPFFRCGVFIMDEDASEIETYLTTPEGESLAAMRLPYNVTPTTSAVVAHWRKGEAYTAEWDREQFVSWVSTIMSHGILADEQSYPGQDDPPEALTLHFAPFEQGMLYVGSKSALNQEELNSVRALAESFAVAYARYEDFQRLEAKNREVEQAMADLRAAQQQLVQQEKMASLGALTAGIAHEIKNPLNFVNNFAALSQELVDELDGESDPEERAAILADLKQNAASIEEHGRRADAIVRSMMDHARTGGDDRRAVAVNELIDEYVNLAYHGRRARDSTFNVDLVIELSDEVGEVELLPQEIGRVLINLLDNAFDAVTDRRLASADSGSDNEPYEPRVNVSTRVIGSSVEMRVGDNGTGIPDEVVSRIFEPFFTTKPTGQGTGLGLSLSYDVITQGHGGTMIVESEKGVGTTFVMTLPLTK